jgi:uncharacterized protein (UPF0332 family)
MTEEESLFERAKQSLRAARLLLQDNLPNIAASRGYYAMFYVAEALLLSRNLSFSKHSAVIAAYGKEFALTNDLDPKFHRYLIASLDTRQIGDYGVEENVSLSEVGQIITWAEEFLEAAKAYLSR